MVGDIPWITEKSTIVKLLKEIKSESISTPSINRFLVGLLKNFQDDEEMLQLVTGTMAVLCGRIAQGNIMAHFSFKNFSVSLMEGTFDQSDLGFQTWHSSVYLSELMDSGMINIHSKAVLEIGSGTGLAGFSAARIASKSVMLTDYHPNVLHSLKENAKLNDISNIIVAELDWTRLETGNFQGMDPLLDSTQWDVVLAADCIYTLEHSRLVPLVVAKYLSGTDFHVVLPMRFQFRNEIAEFELNMQNEWNVVHTTSVEKDDLVYKYYRYQRKPSNHGL